MEKYLVSLCFMLMSLASLSQSVEQRLGKAVQLLLRDNQMKHAIMSLCVVESGSGKVIYALNEQTGLAPASTQKLLTGVAAFDQLGINYRYKTELAYDGSIEKNVLKGSLHIIGYGDPTFGSWRFLETKRDSILSKISVLIKNSGVNTIEGDVILDDSKFSYQPLPGGWIWDDIGNYYGAGCWGINWNENQYDLILKPGVKEGDDVEVSGFEQLSTPYTIVNLLKSGRPGSGDNGYIYMSPYSTTGFVEGTVPAGESKFILSGSITDPAYQLAKELQQFLPANGIEVKGVYKTAADFIREQKPITAYNKIAGTIMSPPLDSIVYWFFQKSINLYGEALIKTFAYETNGYGSTEKGVELLKDFWNKQGIEKSAVNIIDGSGLSPQNRITTDVLVKVLLYAKTRPWYSSFYNALPTYNGMKMKSGTIGGAKAFAGYSTARSGMAYTFAIIINNYDEIAGNIVPKMYKILDELK